MGNTVNRKPKGFSKGRGGNAAGIKRRKPRRAAVKASRRAAQALTQTLLSDTDDTPTEPNP